MPSPLKYLERFRRRHSRQSSRQRSRRHSRQSSRQANIQTLLLVLCLILIAVMAMLICRCDYVPVTVTGNRPYSSLVGGFLRRCGMESICCFERRYCVVLPDIDLVVDGASLCDDPICTPLTSDELMALSHHTRLPIDTLEWSSGVVSDVCCSGSDVCCSGSDVCCSGSEVCCSGSEVCCSGSEVCCSGSEVCCSGSEVCCSGSEVCCSGSDVDTATRETGWIENDELSLARRQLSLDYELNSDPIISITPFHKYYYIRRVSGCHITRLVLTDSTPALNALDELMGVELPRGNIRRVPLDDSPVIDWCPVFGLRTPREWYDATCYYIHPYHLPFCKDPILAILVVALGQVATEFGLS
jgi:hypothetical protein